MGNLQFRIQQAAAASKEEKKAIAEKAMEKAKAVPAKKEKAPKATVKQKDKPVTTEPKHGAKKGGRPSLGKKLISIRLSEEVIAALKAEGDGWQTRANDILAAHYGLRIYKSLDGV